MNHVNTPHTGLRDAARPSACRALALMLALVLATPALAQDQGDDGPFVSAGWEFVGKAEFDENTGQVGTNTLSVNGGYEWLNVSYERTDYTWSRKEHLPFGNRSDDPWDTLHALSLASEHDGRFNNHWGWFAGLGVEAAFEEEMSGSLGVEGYAGGIYAYSDHTAISFGLAASGHETGMDFLPLLVVGWDYVDQTGRGWYAALGIPETMIGYSFSNAFSLTLELGGEDATYRLADDSTVWRKGYVGHEEMGVNLEARWSPLENVSLSLGPTYRFGRSMTIYDQDGEEKKSHDLDNAAGGFLEFSIDF